MRPRFVLPAAFLLVLWTGCAGPEVEHRAALPPEDPAEAETTGIEGEAHGFPVMRTLEGQPLAEGDFTQWLEEDRLHVRIRYDFDASHWIEERSVIQQEPSLVQERWTWVEMRDGAVERRFEVDFLAGDATAEKREDGELRRWSKHVDVEPGRAFAGAAWALAIKSVRSRLVDGEALEFQTVGFTPKPRAAKVEITHDGLDRLPMSGRTLAGDRFRIHAKIPWILEVFVDVPDSRIWLVHPAPAAFLRWEGPLAEPDDELVRVDLLPGEPSGAATPAPPGE
jgi:hypothetical protein